MQIFRRPRSKAAILVATVAIGVGSGVVASVSVPARVVVVDAGAGQLHSAGSRLTFSAAAPGAVDRRFRCAPLRATTTTTGPAGSTSTSTSTTTSTTTGTATPQFSSTFDGPDALVTNEYAYWNPDARDARISPDWELTSGSLFSRDHQGWTGAPDTVEPNATSSNGTDSGVFRLTTRRHDFGDVAVSFDLTNDRLGFTMDTPPVAWDGVHVFLRYQNEQHLYYASVNRRDGTVVIKKKCVGGSDNGGTYYELSDNGDPYVPGHPIPFGTRQHVGATVRNNPDGSVTLTLLREGVVLARATDRGIGCAPIVAPGKVGIRGDNDDFSVDDFTVDGL